MPDGVPVVPEILSFSLFYILLLNLILILVLFYLSQRDIISRFRKIGKTAWIVFLIILIIGAGMRVFWPSCMAADGLCWNYVVRGQEMLDTQTVSIFKYSSGYPFMIALSFFFFGSSLETVLYLNLLMSILTILNVFLITWVLFRKESVALFSALVFSLLPVPVIFARISASEVTATFFATLALLVFLISLEADKKRLYYLAGLLLVFAIHVRLDSSIFIPLFAIGLYLKRKDISFAKLKMPLLLFAVFMIPVSYYYITADDAFGTYHREDIHHTYPYSFSPVYLGSNLLKHAEILSEPNNYPLILYLFLFASVLFVRKERNLLFPLLWAGIFLTFYGLYWGSQISNLDLWQILLHPALAILIGYGIFAVKDITEKCSERIFSMKFLPKEKMFISLMTLFLIFSVFYFGTGVFEFNRTYYCMTGDMISVSSLIGRDDCLLIENMRSDFSFYPPIESARIAFSRNRVMTSLEGCDGETFYVEVHNDKCPHVFFGEWRPLMNKLENVTVRLTEFEKMDCLTLYRVDAM